MWRNIPARRGKPAAPATETSALAVAGAADGLVRELVAALVLDVAVVPAHPVPAYVVLLGQLVELCPEVGVLDRLLRRRLPARAFPFGEPRLHAVPEILGVGGEVDLARLLQCPERLDRRGHLHAVVGGRRVTAADLAPVRPGDQDRPPAAGAGVSGAGAVGEDGDSLHRGTCLYMIDDGRAASAP